MKNVTIVFVNLLITEPETKIQSELTEVNKRYEPLIAQLVDRDEELDLARAMEEKKDNLGRVEEWVQATKAKVAESAPRSSDMGQLNVELDGYKVRPRISEVI